MKIATLRYYERRRLLQPTARRASGYREYAPEAVALVRFIKSAQQLGFTLAEIADLLRLRDGRGRDHATVRALTAAKLADIDERVRRLGVMRVALEALVAACDCGGATHCAIIEALNDDTQGVLRLAANPR
ncbi:MAG: Zn(2+)-responsive transcriptional regulator [Gemmatimonadaceae bacterium]